MVERKCNEVGIEKEMRQSEATPQERIVLLVPSGRNPVLECGWLDAALFGGGLMPPLADGHSQPLPAS